MCNSLLELSDTSSKSFTRLREWSVTFRGQKFWSHSWARQLVETDCAFGRRSGSWSIGRVSSFCEEIGEKERGRL